MFQYAQRKKATPMNNHKKPIRTSSTFINLEKKSQKSSDINFIIAIIHNI